MISALFDLQERQDFAITDIARVRVGLGQRAFDMHGGYATYSGKFQAMLSAHYAAAAVLHDRDLSLRQFEPERYEAPALVRFAAEQVNVTLDTSLSGPQATVELELANGHTVSARCAHTRGSPENPMTAEQVEAKFRRYASPRLTATQIDDVILAVARLEEAPSVRSLLASLQHPQRERQPA